MSTSAVQLQVSVNSAAFATGAITAAFGQTVAMQASSTLPLTSIRYEITDFPPGFTVPSGWSTDPVTGAYFFAPSSVATPPPTFTLPSSGANNWGLFMFRLRGNNNPLQFNADGTPNTFYSPQLTDVATCIDITSPNLGMFGLAAGLTTHLDSMRAWIGPLMQALRLCDNLSSGGGPFTAGGDLGGSAISQNVLKVHGATVPIAGALTTGAVLQVSGASALTYGAVNLALGAAVTGILALANGGTGLSSVGANGTVLTVVSGAPAWVAPAAGAFSAGGDLGGTPTSQNVLAIHGASVPIAGALTAGNLLQVTGVSTLGYAPLNLAGGSNYVTGVLPSSNQGAQTMGGDVTGTTAASVVAKAHGATVPVAGALVTGNVLQVSGVSALSYAPITLSNSNSVGGTLAATNGGTGLALLGTADQLLGMNHAGSALAYFTTAGDLTLASGVFTAVALQGFSVATATPTSGQVLTWNAGTSKWTATTPGSAASVTSSGFWHSTAGTLDAAASKGTAGQFPITNAGATDVAWTTLSGDVAASVSTVGQLTVTAIQAHAVASTAPTKGQLLIQGTSSWAPTSLSGDVTASVTTPGLTTVVALQGFSVATSTPTSGQLLAWNAGTSKWTATTGSAGASVTGSGVWHTTAGTLDAAASKGTAGQFLVTNTGATDTAWAAIAGDATGSTGTPGSLTVTGLRGNPVSVTVATAGQFLIENAAASGSAWTSFSGDVTLSTGTPGLSTVAKINGSTVPAGGALVTGNVLQVSGAAALTYAALNLATAGSVTGTLPVARGGTGLTAIGTADQILGTNHAASALAFFTAAGDVTLSSGTFTVTGIKSNAIPTLAAGYLQWTGSAFAWTAPAGIAVTGSGVWHSTGGTLDSAASKGTSGQFLVTNAAGTDTAWATLSGDTSNSTTTAGSINVLSIHGATVPTAGSLTIGNVLQVAGSATLNYAPLNLGTAASITGVLPIANQASQTMAGDVTGTTAASVVSKISGSSPIAITPATLQWVAATTAALLTQATQTSNIATNSLTLKAQGAFASATGANRNGATLFLKGGSAAAGGNAGSAILQDGATSFLCEADYNQVAIRNAAGTIGCFVGASTAYIGSVGGFVTVGATNVVAIDAGSNFQLAVSASQGQLGTVGGTVACTVTSTAVTLSGATSSTLSCNSSGNIIVQSGLGGSAVISQYLNIIPSGTTGSQLSTFKRYCQQGQITVNGGQIDLDIPMSSGSGCVINFVMQARCTTAGSTMAVGDSETVTGSCSFFVNGSGTAVAYGGNGNNVTILAFNEQGAGFGGGSATPIAHPSSTLGSARLSWLISAATGTLGFCDCTIWADAYFS